MVICAVVYQGVALCIHYSLAVFWKLGIVLEHEKEPSCSTRLKNFKLFLISTKKWLYNKEEGKRADLSDADLRFANLRRADMSDADLRFADLSDAKNIPEIACEDFMKSRVCDSFSPDKAYNHQL